MMLRLLLLLLLLLCCLFVALVSANIQQIDIQFISYCNPTHQAVQGFGQAKCCDYFCADSCDNYFLICVHPNITGEDLSCLYWIDTGDLGDDETTCKSGELSSLYNLSVPLSLEQSVPLQIYVVVIDYDRHLLDDDDLVDVFVITVDVMAFFDLQNYTGEYGYGTLQVSFVATCTEHYFGLDCATFCEERDDELGHFTCDGEGNKVCLQGYQNPSTNCTEYPCGSLPPCENDPCGSLPPCQNGGTCESTEPDQYKCLCAEGFTGTTCEDIGSEGGSSSAAIAGAVSAVVLLLIIAGAAVGAVVFFLWWRRKRQRHIVVQEVQKPNATAVVDMDNPNYIETARGAVKTQQTAHSLEETSEFDNPLYVTNYVQASAYELPQPHYEPISVKK